MKLAIGIILAGAATAAPAVLSGRPSPEEALRSTRVSVTLRDATLREFLDAIEDQAGYPIARECGCGALQAGMDRRGFSLVLRDVPAGAALRLATARASHCGSWAAERERIVLQCGLQGKRNSLLPPARRSVEGVELDRGTAYNT